MTTNPARKIEYSLAGAAVAALMLATAPADAATILSTDFTGRTVSGKTASNIPWTAAGVQNPGALTWVPEGGGPTNTGLFDTANAQGHFAPDMNIDNEGPWSVTIALALAAPQIFLEEVVIDWQHFNNAGAFQTASRSAHWTVSVTGSVSGPLGSVTASNVSGLSGVETLRFTSPLALNGAETCVVKLFVRGNTVGNNTGLDALALNGVIADPDTNAPAILALSPADDATGVPTYSPLAITFGETVRKGSGNILIRRSSDDAVVETMDVTSANVAISGAGVTINPGSHLGGSAGYYVQIAPGAIEDLSGNDFVGIADNSTWNFTTAAADATAPTVSALSPRDNSTGVAPGIDLVITFDEAILKGTGNIVIRRSSDHAVVETIDVASGKVRISGAEVMINPARNLVGNTGYYVQIAPGTFADLSGNDFAGIAGHSAWNFQVAAAGDPILAIEFVEDDQAGFDLWPQTLPGLSSSSASFPTDPDATAGTVTVALTASTSFGVPANRGNLSDGNPAGFSYSGLYRDLLIAQTATGVLTLDFSGLHGNQVYRLTLYSWDPGATNTADKEWTVMAGTGFPAVASVNYQNPLEDNDSFALVFDITATSAGTFQMRNTGGLEQSAINGFTLAKVVPESFRLTIAHTVSGFDLAWNSRTGMLYNVRSSTELSGAISNWTVLTRGIAATPPTNIQSVSTSAPTQFYGVEENPAPPAQMNVLILYADDWRYNTLACAGNPVVQTPNLDRLANQGVRFTRAAVTTSVCWVSRASLYTGQWMSRHGRTTTGASITNWAGTFPGLLRSNGYWVGHVGKWHNGTFPAANYDFGRSYYGQHWYTNSGSPIHVTRRNEDDALDFLRTRPTNRPFCLTVAFFAPHAEDANSLQYLPQPQSTNLYLDVTIPVPPNATDESFLRLPPFIAHEQNEGRVRWHWRFDAPDKYQAMMKNYYRLCSEVDATCGRVLAELEQQGVWDRTLVIFTGDNGYFHGEHGLADKWYPHQESLRVPLIVRDPRLAPATQGMTNDDFVLNVDIAPTILTAAGIGAPATMQGHDLAPLYLAPQKPAWRAEFFYEHPIITSTNRIPASEALVRKDWKYFFWPNFNTEQLFELDSDPREENDRAADPAEATRLAEMRTRFAELKALAW